MSALFHPYTCGRIVAEWLIKMKTQEKNSRFRKLLNEPGVISVPVCYDVISARIIQNAGFDVVAMGGNGTMASLLGYPDIGLATATEMIGRARQIARRIDIPMYCDADTGYGNINNVKRTVQEYEASGASGIHLEDQVMPKRCGDMPNVQVVDVEEAVEKLKVALNTRIDPNFIIIARTDSASTLGVDEAIRRCKLFAEAGADIVMPVGIRDIDDWKKVARAINHAPILCDFYESKREYCYSDEELGKIGCKLVTHGLSYIFAVMYALKEIYGTYKETGSSAAYFDRRVSQDEYEQFLGLGTEFQLL